MINYIFTNSSCITKEIFFYEKKLKWHWFSIGVILGYINIYTSLSFNDEGCTIHKVLQYFRRLNEYRIFGSYTFNMNSNKLKLDFNNVKLSWIQWTRFIFFFSGIDVFEYHESWRIFTACKYFLRHLNLPLNSFLFILVITQLEN